MTDSDAQTNNRIETYLDGLNTALDGIDEREKDDILREIRAHIVDSVERATDRDDAVTRVLRSLGTPAELAGRYRTECMLASAGASFSPWRLLHTSWRWAQVGTKGVIVFLLAVFGYGGAMALTVAVLLKPFMPDRVGMWIGPHMVGIGIPTTTESEHELLGRWFIPVIVVVAFAMAAGTTQALRRLMRNRARKAEGCRRVSSLAILEQPR